MDMSASISAAARIAEAYRRGVEGRDAELLTSMYGDHCEHRSINRNAPPSAPLVLRGKARMAEAWREDCSRDMTHRVEACLVDGDRIALHVTCHHPDGTLVGTMIFAEIENGQIRRETSIECWDE